MMNSGKKRVPLAIFLALASFAVNAAGLGRLTVLSNLGEPFSAEIEVLAASDELASISARIASQEDYANQGFERPSILDGVKVNVGKRSDGSPVLKLTSAHPIDDPFMELVVQMDWQNGRLLREYNALLDPPGFGERALAKSLPVVPENKRTANISETPKLRKDNNGFVNDGAGEKAADVQPVESYVTKRGDTLRQIAVKVKLDDVSMEQMLVGLYQTNTGAFVGGNINRLKVGQTLLVPGSDQLQAISQEDAVKEIKLQTANWSAYRTRLAAAVARSAAQKGRNALASKSRASVAEEKPLATETKYILKVSPGDIEYSTGAHDGKKAPPKKLMSSGN